MDSRVFLDLLAKFTAYITSDEIQENHTLTSVQLKYIY